MKDELGMMNAENGTKDNSSLSTHNSSLNTPAIRFKGFSDDISPIKLKEVVISNTYGPRFNANDYDVNGNVKTIRGTDISSYGNILYHQVPIARLDANLIKSHILEDGDLVMITTADCGLTGIFEEKNDKYIGSAYAVKITLNKTLAFPHYFKYFFQTTLAKNEVNKFIRKATVANLPASGILKITHRLPSKQEQEKIALFLTSLYKLIAQHQHKHDKLLNLKKSLLEKMFPKQGFDVPEIRFKGFLEAWEEKALGENAEFSKGQGYSKSDLVEVGNPIILYGRLYTHYQTVISKVDTFAIESKKSVFSNGHEVVVPASGETADDIARASAISQSGVLLGGDLNIIYPSSRLDSIFLALSISNGKPQKDLSRRAQGKSVVHVRNNDLKEVHISYPDIKEQTKIGNLFKQLDTLINQHQSQLKKLNNIKQACLTKMFV